MASRQSDRQTQASPMVTRRLPIGAEPVGQAGTHFRVWAPDAREVAVALVNDIDSSRQATRSLVEPVPLLDPDADGYFSGTVAAARPGSRYWLQLPTGERFPDPASRFQPDGPHGPSEVVDPAFAWRDTEWPGVTRPGSVVYELHVGTFTPDGTFAAATRELPALADLGIAIIELMPIADFPGRFGWGYDGVLLFAPTRLYGRPEDVRAFVDHAHALGLAVIQDVVYNHLGPDGNYLRSFARAYFNDTATEWGDGFNFDGPRSGPVREFFRANARYWISEFHFDGLRLDATHAIRDRSPRHIIADLTDEIRKSAPGRRTWTVAENEAQDASLLLPTSEGGGGLDGLWNDDFHHAAVVALTGFREAYYGDYAGQPQEFISAAKYGFLYQGQRSGWQRKSRGSATAGLSGRRFVTFIQNHDQIANSRTGDRLTALTSPGRSRAMTALLLLGPWTPMLFQGQEFASSSPFLYFADHEGDLAAAIREGRRALLAQFASWKSLTTADFPDPADEHTFLMSKLVPQERARHTWAVELHRSLIHLRRQDPAFSEADRFSVDGAVLGRAAFVLRYRSDVASAHLHDRLLVVNFGAHVRLSAPSEPLLAAPQPSRWRTIWSSEAPAYGGAGVTDPTTDDGWQVAPESASVLAPEPT